MIDAAVAEGLVARASAPARIEELTQREREVLRDEFANRLPGVGDVDLHDLLDLVDRGCPPELTARILSPLGPSSRYDAGAGSRQHPRGRPFARDSAAIPT